MALDSRLAVHLHPGKSESGLRSDECWNGSPRGGSEDWKTIVGLLTRGWREAQRLGDTGEVGLEEYWSYL